MSRSLRSFTSTMILLLVLGACGRQGGTHAALSLKGPATGTSVKGNVVSLDLTVTDLTLVKADGDTSGDTGHLHVFIDREPVAVGAVIPKEAGIVHSAANPVQISGLSVGEHTFKVVLGDGTHARIGTAVAETKVRVEGPSVKAAVQGTPAAGAPFTINVTVEGATLVKADGDTSGTTGHLHVFIDRDVTPAGQAIPKEAGIIHTTDTAIEIPALAAGDHTVSVVLGDGTHTPVAGPVQHVLKLTL